ncbi:DUF6193 family natural product biosynthesis protein [Spirilliplanes yamanashiensis]|uniref:Uncharacterized protein n=1 Tax=Spirilliplanes yamanashiensis TaxID=42233 RepID=A0A8J4DGG2_9ACTN|nr:DUF6193 family natural product biosynthesis protein [Spirilliplanes yamanashiensis]MDP9820043.1 hypothetical protein [Spirilliplanes yamanashiensis]GIJ01136.1 hypothetical protein Sya03_04880 [Spirilliplanes yamanashiensis]
MSGEDVESAELYLDPAMVWETLLADPDLTRIGALLRAAHADDRLRGRMPHVRHYALSFDASGEPGEEVCIVPLSNGRYVVEAAGEATPADDAPRAVAMAAAAIDEAR